MKKNYLSEQDHEGTPKPDIWVTFSVWAQDAVTLETLARTASGKTDANGYVVLNCYISWDYDPILIDMVAYVSSSGYATIQCSGNYTTTGNTLYPQFWVAIDNDEDLIADVQEQEIAEKFKPVLHKHSYDKSQGLANFEQLLINGKFRLKVYNDIGEELYNQVVSGSPEALHKWETRHWDTYGAGSVSHEAYNLDLEDALRYASAPVGQRPLYYHVYKDGFYYYVQYWYYFGMNDISEQTGTFHESDWEHVSIRLTKNGNTFTPDKINFYMHEGGKTVSESLCWWSSSNALTYSGIQQRYDENYTHLHIWLAANSHAPYNRYSPVFKSHKLEK